MSRTLLRANALNDSIPISIQSRAVGTALKSLCALYLGDRQQCLDQRRLALNFSQEDARMAINEGNLKKIFLSVLLLLQASV